MNDHESALHPGGVQISTGALRLSGPVDAYVDKADPGGFRQSKMEHVIDDLTRARVANFEMEAATIFTPAQLFGLRDGKAYLYPASAV